MRSLSAVELAAVVSIGGTVLAATAPTFVRELHASRMTEAIEGTNRIAAGAIAYAEGKPLAASFPSAAPLTPERVPRGEAVEDPPGTWDHPTWRALGFAMSGPHRYSFTFEVQVDPSKVAFVTRAHGDLNGDGITSTFEVLGERTPGQPALLRPGTNIHREVE